MNKQSDSENTQGGIAINGGDGQLIIRETDSQKQGGQTVNNKGD